MEFSEYLKLLGAILTSVGGATVVIIALSKWFGDFLSKRLLDNYNNKHKTELEGIKIKYQGELEKTKTDLEKAKSQFIRYSEKQFDLYNDLWKVLLYTKHQADELWASAIPEKIPAFGEQIKLTRDAIDDNLLLIEEEHYDKLIELITQFDQFQFGKIKLVEIRSKPLEERENITTEQAKRTINQNKRTKENFDNLLMEIGQSFRNQIKG
ncbi:hypothetical protein CJ739_2495 [Mariniflexile rhizosphaerae]|uniref:hypothetical protein n=1 Tax=unclassified Mariniflexile TaxID=2643887 RepID=UPI000CC8DFC4|nr:hypothetical protein [Mariniflexile sp. TRM1-10]AXP81568.1 hypothetical protein CJ739_2495 [Mariniflexile sp. TRM1-10]PLB17820.1 MAG: hypothetical protein TRG1_3315 [Flavobacteriaceae bacterium FS1-H7996/R]